MIMFACPKRKFRPEKRDSLRKFHRTYGIPLENYLSDRANHYRKCPTVRRPLGNTVLMMQQLFLNDSAEAGRMTVEIIS